MAQEIKNITTKRTSNTMVVFYVIFFLLGLVVIGKILYLQLFWEPDPKYAKNFLPQAYKETIDPERGAIIDHNGRILAASIPTYTLGIDTHIRKAEFAAMKDPDKRKAAQDTILSKIDRLAAELPAVLNEGKDAAYYKKLIIDLRGNDEKGCSKNLILKKNADHETMLRFKNLTLLKEGRYRGGRIIERHDTRHNPYDKLARRVVGYVLNPGKEHEVKTGIEKEFDHILKGEEGYIWKTETEDREMIANVDSNFVAETDGQDIRTTIDINIQDIADKALRKNIQEKDDIMGGCVVVLDVETGAVRAIVNLRRDKDGSGRLGEYFNYATGMASEPGSVFKSASLMTLLEDGLVSLDTKIPTNGGKMDDMTKIPVDKYMLDYEKEKKEYRISVLEGFKRSSNYVFRRLVKDHYGDRPEEFIGRLHEYKFGNSWKFEVSEQGYLDPIIPDPNGPTWSPYDLVASAIGYSVRVTPIQVAAFYNAIANDGKMMKPYLFESYERNGVVTKAFAPEILNGAICSKATADTLTRALKAVASEGTAKRLNNAKCPIAGKTGTARMHLTTAEQNGSGDSYESRDGSKKHQATFVGFFPADAPKYTAIVVIYTQLIARDKNFYGGNIPVTTFKEIADELWAYDVRWGDKLKSRGTVPSMKPDHISISKKADVPVPDLTGMGLKDALYAIENNGYKCRYEGTGHVVEQSPKGGDMMKKGEVISIRLE